MSPQPLQKASSASTWLAVGATCLSLLFLCALGAKAKDAPVQTANPLTPQIYRIQPSDNVQYELQERLINAVPGDVIELAAGKYQLHGELNIACDSLTLRGAGPDKTILSFLGQDVGSEGIVATGNGFVIEKLAVEDSIGNAIKVLGAEGVVFRDVRVEWTGGPKPENGAYGIYPVQCQNVLIEDCVAIGASDAGIYVGQSADVIVRRCRAEQNVAGIEIENTHRADVYENIATNNTGGILVFDLPGLQITNGGQVRVFNNKVFDNNIDNFAPPGNMVATVPPGSGVMILVTDHVELFDNEIKNNKTMGVAIVSFMITQRPVGDPKFDPIPEGIWIHNNQFEKNGYDPSGEFGNMLKLVFPTGLPDVVYDGVINEAHMVDGKVPDDLTIRLTENGEASFANFNLSLLSPENIAAGKYRIDRKLEHETGLSPLPAVSLKPFPEPEVNGNPAVAVYRKAPGELSGWGLFKGNGATQEPVEGVFLYDLNTPLFSDYTQKYRFIKLPDGQPMTYQPETVFDFPVGTVIAKTFSYPKDMRDLALGERLLETRIEQNTETGWYGFTYIWNEAQTDAALNLGGGSTPVSWIHTDGSTRTNQYQFPNANQCITCHSKAGKFVPLGPTARNLNRDFNFADGASNQLAHWKSHALIQGTPVASEIPKLAVYNDPHSGTVADRARAWMDVNCAHCHHPEGSARTSGLDLQALQTTPAKFGVWKSPVATGKGSGGRKYDIVPGKPEESILVYRLESDEAGIRMPNLARSLNHPESIELIKEWIASMPEETTQAGQ